MAVPHSGAPAPAVPPPDATIDDLIANTATIGTLNTALGGELAGTPAAATVNALHGGSTHAAVQAAAEATASAALAGHTGAAEGHTGLLSKTGGGKDTVSTVAASGTSQTLNLASGNAFDVTLTGNCTLTLLGATNGVLCTMTIVLRQDATGSRSVTWPGSVTWPNASAPVLQTAASAIDVMTLFTVDGGTTWYGFRAGSPSTASGYSEGTAFPGSPALNDKFYRTDRNLLYFYDGTRWLTTTQYRLHLAPLNNTEIATTTMARVPGPAVSGYAWYVERFEIALHVVTTNDATNYWTAKLQTWDGATGPSAFGSAVSTQGLAADAYQPLTTTSVAGVLAAGTDEIEVALTKVLSAGTLIPTSGIVVYRLVG